MSKESGFKKILGPIKLNPNQMEYFGPMYYQQLEDNLQGFFKEPIKEFYISNIVISHQGKTDFSLFFGRLVPFKLQYVCDLAIILSYGELVRFLDLLKKIIKDLKTEELTEKSEIQRSNDEKDTVELGLTLTHNTEFFSPNSFLITTIGSGIQIYFGRRVGKAKVGNNEEKETAIFWYSAIILRDELFSIKDAIEKNIARFEETNNVKLNEMILPEIIEENKE